METSPSITHSRIMPRLSPLSRVDSSRSRRSQFKGMLNKSNDEFENELEKSKVYSMLVNVN